MRSILRRSPLAALLAACAATLAPGPAAAQTYPSRPITIVVPAAAGGPTDTVARLIAEPMGRTLGQQILVENVGGAGGTIGVGRVAKAAGDGYTLLVWHIGQATAPALYDNLRYDVLNDFDSIGRITDVPMTIVGKKDLGRQGHRRADRLGEAKAARRHLRARRHRLGGAPVQPPPHECARHQDDRRHLPRHRPGHERLAWAASST